MGGGGRWGGELPAGSVMCEKLLIVVLVERSNDKGWRKCALPRREAEAQLWQLYANSCGATASPIKRGAGQGRHTALSK